MIDLFASSGNPTIVDEELTEAARNQHEITVQCTGDVKVQGQFVKLFNWHGMPVLILNQAGHQIKIFASHIVTLKIHTHVHETDQA